MKEKTNISLTIKINQAQEKFINSKTKGKTNTSEFIRQLINEKMIKENNLIMLELEINERKREFELLEERKKELIKEQEKEDKQLINKVKNLTEEQKRELKDSINILKTKPQLYEGRYNRYKYICNKDITEEEYNKLLNKFKEISKNK